MSVSINKEGTLREVVKSGAVHFSRLLNGNKRVEQIPGVVFDGSDDHVCRFNLTIPTDFTNIIMAFAKITNGWEYDNNTYTLLKHHSNNNQFYTSECPEYGGSVLNSILYYTFWQISMVKYDSNTVSCQLSRHNTNSGTYNVRNTVLVLDCLYVA